VSQTLRTDPSPRNRAPDRDAVLAEVLSPDRLPTPPAIALKVVQAASRPDCEPDEIVALLGRDPALCAKLLRAVNSCVYGLGRPVASIARAVTVLGLNTVRSLTLGLSLPAMRAGPAADAAMRNYWMVSVGGAIVARELAVLTHRPFPDDDLVAGLLRDIGAVLLRQAFPAAWDALAAGPLDAPCEAEEAVFGVTHAEVSAVLLQGWNLPAELIEPIRFHHAPERLADRPPLAERARLLQFADQLAQLDVVARDPAALERVLGIARDRYRLSEPALVAFMERVVPKVTEFGALLSVDIGACPDFGAVLTAGATELVNLTVESSRMRLRDDTPRPGPGWPPDPGATVRDPDLARTPARIAVPPAPTGPTLPEFRPAFLERFPPGGCRLDGYELREVLGRGAMGVVLKGYEGSLDRFVAVKMLLPVLAASPGSRQRFAREARVAAAIQHENVIAIHAVREAAGIPYLAMELVEGSSLEEFVAKNNPVPLPALVRIAGQIAAGLGAAHARHIVHRDIKPANILLKGERGTKVITAKALSRTPPPADPRAQHANVQVKLTDFGLARASNDIRLSADGALIGTPHYMSPEQVTGERADARSDLFGFGAVLYVMCTGRLPFPGSTLAAVVHGVCDRDPVPPRELRPTLPNWLNDLVLRLLRKKPRERFQSADEVGRVLAANPV
jgi:HD-like signal output (HDOD) protein